MNQQPGSHKVGPDYFFLTKAEYENMLQLDNMRSFNSSFAFLLHTVYEPNGDW